MEVVRIPRIKYKNHPGIICSRGAEEGGGALGKGWHLLIPYHSPSGTVVELKKNTAGVENEP